MNISLLGPEESADLLDAEEQVVDQLSNDHVVTDQVYAKVRDIVQRIGLQKVKAGTSINATEIALDALVMIMSLRAPAD